MLFVPFVIEEFAVATCDLNLDIRTTSRRAWRCGAPEQSEPKQVRAGQPIEFIKYLREQHPAPC